jgi:hypothetical protein
MFTKTKTDRILLELNGTYNCLFAKKPTYIGIKSTNNETNTKIIGSKWGSILGSINFKMPVSCKNNEFILKFH